MPLKPTQLLKLLHDKQAEFQTFDKTALEILKLYRQALAQVSQQSSAAIARSITGMSHSGASPLEPLGQSLNWVIPSQLQWSNREQSLDWVREHITGVTTFAVDGSQIYPSKDFSIPVALVQIGWFENLHTLDGQYEKDVALDLLTPTDLSRGSRGELAERQVNQRRFQLETERLIDYIKYQATPPRCLIFFDGSLVATFAELFEPDTRDFYVQCIVNLLRASEQYQVPLVGYVDTTYARDLVLLLQAVANLPSTQSIHDAQLLYRDLQWGDRSPLFLCQRAGILSHYGSAADTIAFCYLKTNEGYPARIEFPRWMYESGNWQQVIDWVRAEVVIGSGYPYALETADQTAVLQAGDRQTFYRLFQDWAEQSDIQLRLSRKMVSKARRR
jgi:hypothetical protein